MKPIPFKGRAFVSIFGGIFTETLENSQASTWHEFFTEIHVTGKPLRPLPKAGEALDQLEVAGFEVVLICPASHFLKHRAEMFLQDLRVMSLDQDGHPRQVLFKSPHTEVDAGPDWVAGMVATQGGRLFIGPQPVIEVVREIAAPGVECYASLWAAYQPGGPLAGFNRSGQPDYAA